MNGHIWIYYKNLGTTTFSRVFKGLCLKIDDIHGVLATLEHNFPDYNTFS